MTQIYGNKKAKKTIVFLHANAYPASTYRFFLNRFKDYKVVTWEQRPLKDPDYDSFYTWDLLVDDFTKRLEEELGDEPVILMGHSMGAVIGMYASFRLSSIESLVMIDPVFLPRRMLMIKSLAPSSYMYRAPIVKKALKRKDRWESVEEAREYFANKRFFQQFAPEAQEDFIKYGLIPEDDVIALKYPKMWEAKIYATVPNPWRFLSKIDVPTFLLRGQYSDVITPKSWKTIKNKVSANVIYEQINDAGHLMIQEKPQETYANVRKYLDHIESDK